MKITENTRLRLIAAGLVTGILACALAAGCTPSNNDKVSTEKDQAPVEQKSDETATTADENTDAATEGEEEQAKSAVAGTETRPSLMPASHEGRAGTMCYACHGASDRGNPSLATATAMPDGHYVNNDPSGYELDPVRNQCFTCHSIDPQKEESSK
ncbi:MAG: hypothetical protein IKE43_02505 [Coriobacteriales bacterium]|nr:hypothetical protein [Coriobacteriales bacterium]